MNPPKLLPLTVKVTRYKCPACSRSHATKQRCAHHIERCWYATQNKACKTCRHAGFDADSFDGLGRITYQGTGPTCDVGVDLPDGEAYPLRDCEKWFPADWVDMGEEFDEADHELPRYKSCPDCGADLGTCSCGGD